MKVIEKKMNEAINARKNWNLSNTSVEIVNGSVFVRLYGHLIYCLVEGAVHYSTCGYNTVTMASRLRALGLPFSTNAKKNQAGPELSETEMQKIYWDQALAVFDLANLEEIRL